MQVDRDEDDEAIHCLSLFVVRSYAVKRDFVIVLSCFFSVYYIHWCSHLSKGERLPQQKRSSIVEYILRLPAAAH